MDLREKSKVSLLKHKALFEEDKLVNNQLSLGNADLLYHLNFFKKKLNKDLPNQAVIFDYTFFGKSNNKKNDIVHKPDNTIIENKEIKKQEESSNKSHPSWVKKLYKQIVGFTHPDKLLNISVDTIIEKLTEYYMLAVASYNEYRYENLLMIGNDIGISIDNKLVEKYIEPSIKLLNSRISKNKTIIGYHWYHIDDEKKEFELENFLKNMGFIFTKEEVKNAIKKGREKNKRKVGTRPVNRRRMKLK